MSRSLASPGNDLLAQAQRAIDLPTMQKYYPKSYGYLQRFNCILLNRRTGWYQKAKDRLPFYMMFSIGDYTFAPYKVVWREQASQFTAAVVLPQDDKPVLPDHKLMLCALDRVEEAFYLYAALNSSPAVFTVQCYSIGTQMDTHIAQNIHVPRFDPVNPVHQRLAALSQRAHEVAEELSTDSRSDKRIAELKQELTEIEAEVDQATAKLWGITAQELAEVQHNLAELNE